MAKSSTQFVCQSCGTAYGKWAGKCEACGEWNTLVEESVISAPKAVSAPKGRGLQFTALSDTSAPPLQRIPTSISELDRVLGGGLVPGSAILIGGDPGIGKSTLLLQMAGSLSHRERAGGEGLMARSDHSSSPHKTSSPHPNPLPTGEGTPASLSVAYISGEESTAQIQLRARRLGLTGESPTAMEREEAQGADHERSEVRGVRGGGTPPANNSVALASATNVSDILASIDGPNAPSLVIIDSIQTMFLPSLDSAPGTVAQVRAASHALIAAAKKRGICVVLVGHVTKDGQIAGHAWWNIWSTPCSISRVIVAIPIAFCVR